MPSPTITTPGVLGATGSPNSFNIDVGFDVDYFDVDKMYDLVSARLTGSNLALFLVNEGHRYLGERIARRFLSQGDNKSGVWAPLTDATQDIRAAMGVPASGPINIRTALLGNRGSLFDFVTEHYEIHEGPDFADLDVPGQGDPIQMAKLETAQRGSDNNPLDYSDTPARPVLADATEEDLQELLMLLEGWIMVEVAGAMA